MANPPGTTERKDPILEAAQAANPPRIGTTDIEVPAKAAIANLNDPSARWTNPAPMIEAGIAEFLRRRKTRNIAIALSILGLSALFFAITIAKMSPK